MSPSVLREPMSDGIWLAVRDAFAIRSNDSQRRGQRDRSVNAKSALKLGQVRGVALLAAARQGIPVAEDAPLKIKSSVVGYGLAQKEQVQFMVARLLGLAELPNGRCRRCVGDRHLPHPYRANAGLARGGKMRAVVKAAIKGAMKVTPGSPQHCWRLPHPPP